ncbi:MAG: radical SAM protein [Candidatus Abyssobacteria bacterium SURF_5]|uniref:Radical SAM protein n=1 Tax=Abyssobacteria bacterium (strain SURF_5) TaxID=2093360 RepID=A0A3A4NLN3_ABYX5|nr:MAG: radical SAM protein [Candidatus Abyssubacteria bacterium SURF_5]
MKSDVDFILISQSEVVNYSQYSELPLDRIDMYRELVFPRMIYYRDAFRSPIDLLNMLRDGVSFQDASYEMRRRLLSVWNLPSLSGMHIANYLLAHGFQTCIINNFDAEFDRFHEVYTACKTPPLVGISSTFHLSFSELKRIIGHLRKVDPEMEIVVGGAFANAVVQNAPVERFEKPMRRFGIDYILHGFNSETDLRDLLMKRGNGGLQDISNMAYLERRNSGDAIFQTTKSQWHPAVLNEMPALWDQLDLPFVNRTVQLRTSSGCPFSCAFCSYPKVAHGFHLMDAGILERQIQSVLKVPGIRQIVFVDDTFNVPRVRFKELCRLFSKYEFDWFSFLRVQFIDDEIAQLMRESGCRAVYLGIESASDQVLRNMNKRATREDYERGIRSLRKYGIRTVAAFVIGFPGENERTLRENQDFIESSGIDYYTLKEFYYMEHTPIHSDRERYKLTGSGNKWSHETMNSVQAYEAKIGLFQEIKNSCFIDPDTSLWNLVVLLDAGFSLDQAQLIQREINVILREQLNGSYDSSHPAFGRLKELVAGQEAP